MPLATTDVRRNRIGRTLDVLEERAVPAVLVDLTTRGSEGAANGALFRQTDARPTGTGFIHSFLRLRHAGAEQGYNTDARPLQFNELRGPRFTRSLALGDVPVVVVNGVHYREFLLDINQQARRPLLSLDELRLYVGGAPNLTGYDPADHTLTGLTPVFDLDSGDDVTVKMNYRLNAGSGRGDVTVLIPDAAFGGQPGSMFVYLYSKFGETWGGNAGFEEWAVHKGPTAPPPEPPPPLSSLSGYVYFDADQSYTHTLGDIGIAGVEILLQGIDASGQAISLTTTTNANGYYEFIGLQPGTYSIYEPTEPTGVAPDGSNFVDWVNNVGSLGGASQEYDGTASPVVVDAIIGITVGSGVQGTEYDFGEWSESMIHMR